MSFSKTKIYTVYWWWCPGFGSRGDAGVSSVRRHQGLPPHARQSWFQQAPSRPPLHKNEPISEAGRTFTKAYLRKDTTARMGEE